jgi:hypothetical protein
MTADASVTRSERLIGVCVFSGKVIQKSMGGSVAISRYLYRQKTKAYDCGQASTAARPAAAL